MACRCASLKYAGTVMTALVTGAPKKRSALRFSCCRMYAEISGGVSVRPPTLSFSTSPVPSPSASLKGKSLSSGSTSARSRPMRRFTEYTALPGWRSRTSRAALPTAKPCAVSWSNATTEGTMGEPSSPGITVGVSPPMKATSELVVPRSMPTTRSSSFTAGHLGREQNAHLGPSLVVYVPL